MTGPAGAACDDDGASPGGEPPLTDLRGHRRPRRFSRAPRPGAEAAVRRPARAALGTGFGGERYAMPTPVRLAAELSTRRRATPTRSKAP